MQWFKSLFHTKAPATTKATPIPAALDFEVPRYPPFMKGLPTVAPERLLAQHPEILAQYKRSVIVSPEQYEQFYIGALRRFAAYAHLLPASQTHHHRGAGGLLRHSMEVALWSLQGADNMLLSMGKSPAQRRSIEPRWQLTAFLAGLCHDVGKPATDMTITDSDRKVTWKPLTEDLYDWAQRNNLKSYFLDWRPGRGKQHVSLSNLLAERIIGSEALQWIDEGGTELVVWLMEALSGNPGATNPLYDLVIRADSSSTERDLKTMGVAMAGYELGVPIERHLMDIMRRLIKEGIWQVNELGARVWNINGGIYLVWPASGDEIAAKVRSDDLKGFPRTPDGILDMLLERGLAFVRETGEERFWKIVPAVLEAKIPNKSLACIRLRDDAMISSTPIAAVPGRLINGEEDDDESTTPSVQSAAPTESVVAQIAPLQQTIVRDPLGPLTPSMEEGGSSSISAAAQEAPRNASRETQSESAPSASALPSQTGAEASKRPSGKFEIDPDTGEILGVVSGTPEAKKQPEIRKPNKSTTSESPQAISKPIGLKMKTHSVEPPESPDAPSDKVPDAVGTSDTPKKKKRKKGSYTQAPDLEFTGSVGELFLALADDLQSGAKQWGHDVRVDDQEMVLLRWPASFANYGLTAKTILDECSKNGWIWVDQDMPFTKLVDTKFEGEDSKALRLMPEPGDALLFHAKYNPEIRIKPNPRRADEPPQPVAKPGPASLSVETAPVDGAVHKDDSQSLASGPEQLTLAVDDPCPAVGDANVVQSPAAMPAKPARKKAAPKQEASSRPGPNAQTEMPKTGTPVVAKVVADPEKSLSSSEPNDPRVKALLKVLQACPASKEEKGWRYIDRMELRRAALAAGVVKDRKDLNEVIETNAKSFQVDGALLRYKPLATV